MKNHERLIQFYDLYFEGKTWARDVNATLPPPVKFDKLMNGFQLLLAADEAIYKSKTGRRATFIQEIKELNDHWVLLVNNIDADAASIITAELESPATTRQITNIGGHKKRGYETSAHLLIKKVPELGKRLALFESGAGVSFGYALTLLNSLSKQFASLMPEDHSLPHPSGEENKFIKTYCWLRDLGHLSDQFYEELKNGTITDIRLGCEQPQADGYDVSKHSEILNQEIVMSTKKEDINKFPTNIQYFNRAKKLAKELSQETVKIRFKDATGTGHTAEYDVAHNRLINEDKYVKRRKISGFNVPLRTAYDSINDEIVNKMLGVK